MNILLTQAFVAREPRTPIPLLDLAPYWRRQGHDVTIAYAQEATNLPQYDLVGISAILFGQAVYEQLKTFRQSFSGRIVFGGKGARSLQSEEKESINNLGVEIVVGGGESLFDDGAEIDYQTYPAWEKEDFQALDSLPLSVLPGGMTEMMSTRGCPYSCAFCYNTEPRVSYFSPERTVENANLILNGFNRNRIFFVDDIFTINASRMLKLLATADAYGLELRNKTCFFVHVDQLNADKLAAVQEYNPREVQIGIESGDDGMLSAMGKTFTAQEAKEKIQQLHAAGIRTAALFMIGFPGETKQSLRNTLRLLNDSRKYLSGWWVSYYQPVPYTRGWELAKERVPNYKRGEWNTEISYLDPNLTEQDLTLARQAMMTY